MIYNLPVGLGYALAQNVRAKDNFLKMNEQQQAEIIRHSHTITSDEDMLTFVATLENIKTFE